MVLSLVNFLDPQFEMHYAKDPAPLDTISMSNVHLIPGIRKEPKSIWNPGDTVWTMH